MSDPVNAALLALRIVVGIVFIAHGVKHARGREKTSKWFGSIGFRNAQFQWFMSTANEIVVGVMMLAGFLTALAAASIVGILGVAYWVVHRAAGFWVTARPDEGYEYVLTLIVVALALALAGPGEWSLDDAIGIADNLDGWWGLVIFGGGFLMAAGEVIVFWRPKSVEISGD